ncbi:methyl-accepting chemotaxis sensory transducer with phytochrome sensor [Richelia sinica FACHB-800]|uniref:Methyl-accepting chemotaxis sensory transducer with phytochrome sensor n=1 Tax=Richelia sinica FACHB-800 TaxID=1357546 RepID=A0A975Y6M4_9NOST|nr:GAF domain-containing protein [Richelia sinica]MBD2664851.1 GAF domain-containing protein [Richelia sinica FACHB-800]QXE25409.1 methyl-accepting chemotaxis sensory transducer with phytochrome sensor [Richelia sinica FACHB-800]
MTTLYESPSDNSGNVYEVETLEVKPENGNIHHQDPSVSNVIAQEFKVWRQRFENITIHMRQASDLEALLKTTVTQVRDKFGCDRVVIYQFTSDEAGTVVAESRGISWTPTLGENLPAILFGLYTNQDYVEPVVINDINHIKVTPYQQQLLEKFQVKSSLSLPISIEGKIWGLLVVHNCVSPRTWQETETTLLSQISTEITYRLQKFNLQKELQQSSLAKQSVAKVITKILQQPDVEKIFQTTTQEVRHFLKCDRVGVYRFNPDWSGQFVAEAVGNNWVKIVTPDFQMVWEDTHLQETKGGRYAKGETFVVNDIYKIGHTQCHVDILDQIEAKAYIIAPIFSGEKLWGLLGAYQNTGSRVWQDWEISFLTQIGLQFGVAISQGEYLQQVRLQSEQLEQIAKQEKALTKIVNRIRQSFQVEEIFKTTTHEVRQSLRCDRVGIYRFNPDWSGEFIAESVGTGWVKLVGPDIKTVWEDTHLQETQGGRYAKGENFVVNDIYQVGHAQCHIDILEQFEVKAYMIVPIFFGEKLWGLLAAYQNSGTRVWQPWEVSFLTQVGLQFSLAKSQIDYLEQVQAKSEQLEQIAEREKTFNRIVNRIRQSLDEAEIFRITTQEIRQLLKCDRVAVYQFHPDWGGEFVAESVGSGWVKLVGPDIKTVWDDTNLQETQGGRYAKGESFVVNDIYQTGHAQCHIAILEQFEVKAYMIVPIFFGDKLWGLLAAYQNSGTRVWQSWEVNFLEQIGLQFSLAKSQIDYLEKLRLQSEKLMQIAEQEKAFTKIVNRIRQSLDIEEVFKTTTQEVRQLLKCDRVAVYQFTHDWGGEFVAESVASGWVKLVGIDTRTTLNDPCLQQTEGGRYNKNDTLVVNDIHQAGFDPCYVEILEGYEAKAYIIAPIFFGEKLWGLLAAYQNSSPRNWEESQVNLIARVGDQLGLALKQTEYLNQLQTQSTKLAEAAEREKAAKELLQQRSIQLLTALGPALSGDLTVRAPVTEDELGTIAGAYNSTLQALRQIVLQVQDASQQVAQTSSTSNASLVGLTDLAKKQSEEISQALSEIQQMVDSTQGVVSNAQLVQVAVQQANKTVDSGDIAMNQTVNAIQTIRETVAQTSKKIKRLSESSQKISKVVNLIGNFATQTNVLALNAAIEATRAGEYGKGFAVVADEVRSLSRQSAAATIEIEKLVQEIQAETGEVAVAMETGIQQVVEGTNLVNETRQNLNAIVAATAEISQLIEQITDATQQQMNQSVAVTKSMNDVAEIAHQTFGESQEIATVFQNLSVMAQDLLATASKFKVN